MPFTANRVAVADVYEAGDAFRRCGLYETLMFLWWLIFQRQQLGFGPQQLRPWQREPGVRVWTEWRCSDALLHPSGHPHRGAALLGAWSGGVPCPGGSARGGQIHRAAEDAPELLVELHMHRPRQLTGPHRGRAEFILM